MRQLTIAVDVDDVCADLIGFLCLRSVGAYHPDEITSWKLPESWMYDALAAPSAYDNIQPIAGSLRFIKALRRDHRVIFVTSAGADTMGPKLRWLERWGYLPDQAGHPNKDFFAAKDKSLIRADVLVDDRPENCFNFPGLALLRTVTHNLDWSPSFNTLRFDTFDQALKEIEVEASVDPFAAARERLITSLIPIAQEQAKDNPYGITVAYVRSHAESLGLLTGNEPREVMSGLGQLMQRAGLITLGRTERDQINDKTHGNIQRVWYPAVCA